MNKNYPRETHLYLSSRAGVTLRQAIHGILELHGPRARVSSESLIWRKREKEKVEAEGQFIYFQEGPVRTDQRLDRQRGCTWMPGGCLDQRRLVAADGDRGI